MFAQTGSQSFAAKAAKYDPRLECAESTAELHAIVHVIFCGFHGVAAQDVRWRERKDTAQALQITHVQDAEIQRHKKGLVRIDNDRIGAAPTFSDPFVLRKNCEPAAVRSIDMQPHFFFVTKASQLNDRIDAGRRSCSSRRDDSHRFET